MTFQKLFPKGKAIIAMLHLMGHTREDTMKRAKREIEIYHRNGIDAVLVENYFGDIEGCENALVFGGVRFKYQPVASGRSVGEDLQYTYSRLLIPSSKINSEF